MFKEKAIRKIATQKTFCAKIRIGLQYIIGIGCHAPAVVCLSKLSLTSKHLQSADSGATRGK